MADELNKDVVGAMINLDTSKMPAAFKQIDDGAQKNKPSAFDEVEKLFEEMGADVE